MTAARLNTNINIASRGDAADYAPQSAQITDIFGAQVFNDNVMRQRLPKQVYKTLKKTIQNREPLDAIIADTVAAAMKDWAVEQGATHFTHWFQPLTGATAEKHDAFLVTDETGGAMLQFSGKELVQGEPDASSFPSGGIRATFEARGYTAWDPTSPAFIRKTSIGATLCIPTAFCSYTGEALDKKTPLLRSEAAISKSAAKLLNILGSTDVTGAYSNAGLEQEYFLVDMEYFNQRPDMIATGRTLFGAPSYKGQSQDDHYFGAIKSRIRTFMEDSEHYLYRLGIPVKTRHNEVAPGQYEVAPIFESANIAVDHNMLIMEVMKEVAARHKFKMLLHEKPFAGLNGSGKHCNWSMTDSLGNNLLEPGHTPHENMQFLVVLTAIIRAVDKYAKLLRLSVAFAGNDHRLGANEAPPAIISIFLGAELDHIVDMLVSGGETSSVGASKLNLGSTVLPPLPKDTTDRNRTSPFAFTGNKFEFRALGASQHVAGPVFFINTMVAESMDFMSAEIQAKLDGGAKLEDAVDQIVKATLTKHKRVIFNGDGYSQEWQDEAAKRGLYNLKTTPEATATMMDDDVVALFEKYNVLTQGELESRYNIKLEAYILSLEIEVDATKDIAKTILLPAALKYQAQLGPLASGPALKGILGDLSGTIEAFAVAIADLEAKAAKGDSYEEALDHANYYRDELLPAMGEVRVLADQLEGIVADELWPLPKYREMLMLM